MPKTTENPRVLERWRKRARREGRPTNPPPYQRPATRGDCLNMPRPCAYVGCRHHLFLEVDRNGSIHMPFGSDIDALRTMPETCSLDVADKGGITLEEAGENMAVSKERVRQMEQAALHRMDRRCGDLDPFRDAGEESYPPR